MPEPGTAHVSAALTNVSVAYGVGQFLAERIFPVLPVGKQADKYFIIDAAREEAREIEDLRPPGGEAKLVDFKLSDDTYCCEDHALRAYVPHETEKNADPAVARAIPRVNALTRRINLNRERELAALLFNATTFSGYTSATALKWDQATGYGDPIAAVDTAKANIQLQIGLPGNVALMGRTVFNAVRRNPDITDQLKYTSSASLTPDILARILGLDEVLVGDCAYNSAAEGATATLALIWPTEYCLVFYRPPSPGLETPALGYDFRWKAMGPQGVKVERWEATEGRNAMGVAVHKYYDFKLVGAAAGYLYSNCVGAS